MKGTDANQRGGSQPTYDLSSRVQDLGLDSAYQSGPSWETEAIPVILANIN